MRHLQWYPIKSISNVLRVVSLRDHVAGVESLKRAQNGGMQLHFGPRESTLKVHSSHTRRPSSFKGADFDTGTGVLQALLRHDRDQRVVL